MKKIILILFLLTTKLTEGQIINGGFEVWDTTYANLYSPELDTLFGVPNPIGGIVNNWTFDYSYGRTRTTDSYSGNYSLILHNWYSYVNAWISYHDTLNYRPQYFQGYFKYITGGFDPLAQGDANITLTRFNGFSSDTIATGTYEFDSTTVFTPFQITLNYISALNPDSIIIYIINAGMNQDCNGIHLVCNLLYLDNLTLSNSPLGIENLNSNENLVSVFPNPSNNILSIENNSTKMFQFTLYNSLGEKLIDKILPNKTSTINLSAFANDIYFYKVSNDKQEIKSGKIIKQ